MKATPTPPYRFIASLAALSGVSVLLLLLRVAESSSMRYVFLLWNLFLALVPLLLAWWLVMRIREQGWLKWQQILLTLAWLGFLPNSFYIITDFVHLRQNYEASLIYDIALLMGFALSGMIFGLTSIYLVHRELVKRLAARQAWLIVSGVLLLSSFAMYLGRFTRWNTWDVLLRPAGLLFDVSDRFINPAAHTQTYQTTFVFFVVLMSLYWVVWEGLQLVRRK